MNNSDLQKLLSLSQKVQSGKATKDQTDQYMSLLLQNKSITAKQYSDYKSNRNVDDIVNAAVVIGGIVLLGYLLGKLTE
ncbi:hypothetical protein RT717_00985 [Imperialibacter roseus]|uniref:Uncharacterized protein n=1 Tax=Imperialibacter roseus TaxID=1324217 RepID=A0ABZ0IS10_9BACT|nr:hypothetical protein [Imperialibacter roseus]WOK07194.1 hypothetical protein RT717_00985 [Imperialibacter roseus]